MSGQRALLWAALLGVGMVVIFAHLLQQVRLSPEGGISYRAGARSEAGHAEEAAALAQAVTQITVAKLPCFDCHALAQYLHGAPAGKTPMPAAVSPAAATATEPAFSHAQHAEEGVGHCHKCHAFKGHFQVTTREATCEDCH